MDEELLLQQPTDRRMGNVNSLPPGPPGAEFDTVDFDTKNAPKSVVEKDKDSKKSTNRFRSPSPKTKGKSTSRGGRSPTPERRRRRSPSPRRRSPSPRRNRFRDYSPDRRRYEGRRARRSPDRRRSPPPRERRGNGRERDRDRDRYYPSRGRSNSRSRSASPPSRHAGSSRWSPTKETKTPALVSSSNVQAPPPPPLVMTQPPPPQQQPQNPFNVMAPPPMYGETYGPPVSFNQYAVTPQQSFPAQADNYSIQRSVPPPFNSAYPPPPAWGVNDGYNQQNWMQPPVSDANALQQPPPVGSRKPPSLMNTLNEVAPGTVEPPSVNRSKSSNTAHDAVVVQEAEQQREQMKKQRLGYLRKISTLKKELGMLKDQRKELSSSNQPPSPTTKGFIDENETLQAQIKHKLNTMESVVDMLSCIIGEDKMNLDDVKSFNEHGDTGDEAMEKQKRELAEVIGRFKKEFSSSSTSSSDSSDSSSSSSSSSNSSPEGRSKQDPDDDSSPSRLKTRLLEAMISKKQAKIKRDPTPIKKETNNFQETDNKRYNYVFYDPELHWCETCNTFPKSAKDYLNHLHTKEHMEREGGMETPWHKDMINDQFPTYSRAPIKRRPICGLSFFVPATAWFCKLCNIWMGDLHCASTHLKSQLHSKHYGEFITMNPLFESNWLSERENALGKGQKPPLTMNASMEYEFAESKIIKKEEAKPGKKRKRSDKKDKKKKKRRTKRGKKSSSYSSSSCSDSSSEDSNGAIPKKSYVVKELDNPNRAESVRLAMRKQESSQKTTDHGESPPPPPPPLITPAKLSASGKSNGTSNQWEQLGAIRNASPPRQKPQVPSSGNDHKQDDSIIQQWNTVQPVISESEKKMFEQLKGKLKNKPRDEAPPPAPLVIQNLPGESTGKDGRNKERDKERDKDREKERDKNRDKDRRRGDAADDKVERSRRSRSLSYRRGGRAEGRRRRRSRSRTRSRSRGRLSPGRWGGGRRRRRTRSRTRSRSRSRSLRRRSRSHERRRRLSRSRTRSSSRNRVEKAIVKHAEFRPRVPEKEKEKDKKSSDAKDKKDAQKKAKSSSGTTSTAATTGKKLPFIGKMPVFKKQTGEQMSGCEKSGSDGFVGTEHAAVVSYPPPPPVPRQHVPTAAQIQMAMMEDAYGNAPPFHPDAAVMIDYDDLMPDPVQFVNIMSQAPPPPPTPAGESAEQDESDMLPPGIDEMESEEFVPKPIPEEVLAQKGALPKDLEEALNIIFPGERQPGDEDETEKKTKSTGETQIIVDEPVMQVEDLVREGIHMVTIAETNSLACMDEASQLSMNEPLVFNKPVNAQPISFKAALEEAASKNVVSGVVSVPTPVDIVLDVVPPPPPSNATNDIDKVAKNASAPKADVAKPPMPDEIPMPQAAVKESVELPLSIDLGDIPHPPASPSDSEKQRRQEELDDLAMLGIDASDLAAQCM